MRAQPLHLVDVSMPAPWARDAGRASIADARAMYRRAMAGWAMDALRLRRLGLDRPSGRGWRGGLAFGAPRAEGERRAA